MEKANKLHEEYIRQMAKMFDRIKHKFENFRDQCFSEEQVRDMKEQAQVDQLIISGEQ